jgi:hypothetical protein
MATRRGRLVEDERRPVAICPAPRAPRRLGSTTPLRGSVRSRSLPGELGRSAIAAPGAGLPTSRDVIGSRQLAAAPTLSARQRLANAVLETTHLANPTANLDFKQPD